MKYELNYPSIEDLRKHHLHLMELIKNPFLSRTDNEQEEILQLKLKGINTLKKQYSPEEIEANKMNFFKKELSIELANVGMVEELSDYAVKKMGMNPNDSEEVKMSLVKKIKLELEEKLELKPKQNNDENNKENEDVLDIQPVAINHQLLEQEIRAQASLSGETKEVVLPGAYQNQNGQIVTSLVTDISEQKIENIAANIDNVYNQPKVTEKETNQEQAKKNKGSSKEDKSKNKKENEYENSYLKILRKIRIKSAVNEIKKQNNGNLHLEDSKMIERNTTVDPQKIHLSDLSSIGARISKMKADYMQENPKHSSVMDSSGLITTTVKLK